MINKLNTAVGVALTTIGEVDLADIETYISDIVKILMWLIVAVGVIILISIGFQMMTAQQAEERQKLKSRLIWFGIGTGVVLLASTIYSLVTSFFGYKA